MQAKMNRPIT